MKPQLLLKGLPENPDQETLELVQEYKRQLEANPLNLYYPEPKQKEFHSATTRVKALIAANRIGKTTALICDMLIQALPMELVPEHLREYKVWGLPNQIPFRGRILGPGLTRTLDGVLLDKIQEWCPAQAYEGGTFKKAYDKQSRVLRFANGAFIDVFSYEQDLQALSGIDLHRVAYDEEPPGERGKDIRNESHMRLLDHRGDEVFALTPLLGYSFIKESVYDKRNDPEVTVIQASMHDALHITEEQIKEEMENLTEEEIEARIHGKFVHFGGLVYSQFNPDIHVVPRPDKKHVHGLDIYISIDPGIRTTAIVFGGYDKENSLLVFDELYLHGQEAIPENASAAIKAKLRDWGTQEKGPLEPMWALIDPSARNRQLTVEMEGVQAAYQRSGINAFEAQNDVEAGVFEVKRRLQSTEPQMFFMSEACIWLKWELEKYRVKEKPDGSFGVVKEDDHAVDALRYMALARPLPILNPVKTAKSPSSWVPGTAPPYRPSGPSTNVGPLGAMG